MIKFLSALILYKLFVPRLIETLLRHFLIEQIKLNLSLDCDKLNKVSNPVILSIFNTNSRFFVQTLLTSAD